MKQQARLDLELMYQKENVTFLLEDSDMLIADSVEGAIRVRDIVQSLRRFSHPDTGQIERVNLNDSVESTIKIVAGEFKHSVHLNKQLCADRLYVMGKSNQIGQVFLNIMMNARQAINHDHGELQISSGVLGHEAWVAVEDNGAGIAPHYISRLFEPFFTTKDVGKGTGLGLSLCHSIMLQHSGRIDVQSEPGVFSRFTLYFPLASPVESQN